MQSNIFRVSHGRTDAVLGDPYISDAETLTVHPVRSWQPWRVHLGRYGAISVDLRDNDTDSRASIDVQIDTDAGRDALASAVVAYVAGLGDFSSSVLLGEWCGNVIDRVSGALEAAKRKHAERMEALNAEQSEASA